MTAEQDSEAAYICHACIGNQFLADEVKRECPPTTCSYCGETCEAIALDDLADRIHNVLHEHFKFTPDYPDEPHDYFLATLGKWERRGDPVRFVIAEMAGLEEEPADDLTSLLSEQHSYTAAREGEEDPYGSEAMYEEREPFDLAFRLTWAEFCRQIRSRSRFFNADGERMLGDIFGNLTTHRTYEGRPVLREINPHDQDRFVWRARIATSSEAAKVILKNPAQELGPPPSESAGAGRMNAHGIPVFYGAFEQSTCVSELRPPVGSCVVIGKFELLRTVNLLDLDALTELSTNISYFDPECTIHKGRAAFLKHSVHEISQPILPEVETLEYIATQVVAEYLAQKTNLHIDGIIYPSSQTEGNMKNVVLFNHASRVEPYTLPEGSSVEIALTSDIFAISEDDSYGRILVSETVPSNPVDMATNEGHVSPSKIRDVSFWRELFAEPQDDRGSTLRLDTTSLSVLRVSGVEYSTSDQPVSRLRQTVEERDAFERRFAGNASFNGLLNSDSQATDSSKEQERAT